MNSFKQSNLLGWVIGILIVAITLVVMFPPEMSFLKRSAEFAVYIMLAFLVLGMFFMMLDHKRLMFLSLACTSILCLFLKSSSNKNFIFPARNDQPVISLAHINLSYVDQSYDELLTILEELDPEIISFQEMTPDWDLVLKTNLSEKYISKYSLVRIDPYGMAIYSKRMIASVDTFMFADIPNIQTEFRLNSEPFILLSSYLLPKIGASYDQKIKDHLDLISKQANGVDWPIFALGDYKLVPWSNEMRNFIENTGLLFSRRNIAVAKFQIPYDHIMHSDHLECINFKEIEDARQNHIGIFGTYQIKSNRNQYAKNQ